MEHSLVTACNSRYWDKHCAWGSDDVGEWWSKHASDMQDRYCTEDRSYGTETDTTGWEIVLQIMAQEEMYDSKKPIKHSKWSIR